MANPGPPQITNEMLADVYERLKLHEQTLSSLAIEVEALKTMTLPGHHRLFGEDKEKRTRESASELSQNLLRFDEIIARLRGNR